MYSNEQLNEIYEKIVKAIDISDALFDSAEKEYIDLGNWVDAQTPEYKISIYPQGSFALGTVIKPIKDMDDYDLDLVCEFQKQYGLSARQLKLEAVGPLLSKYRKPTKLEEKRRCWHVDYANLPNFHMDVIPAIGQSTYIDITDHDEDAGTYEYIGSNPKGYIEWFNKRKLKRRTALYEHYIEENRHVVKCQADVEKIKEYNFKTPLQKAIQLLKRHRDVMFEKDDGGIKPISIIITTVSAQLYNNEESITDALTTILNGAKAYVLANQSNGNYHVDNPSYTGGETENFADKWNEHPERADAFFDWIEDAKNVFITSALEMAAETDIANMLGMALGDNLIHRVFSDNINVSKSLDKQMNDTSTAIVPYKVKNILAAPHRQKCPWGDPKGSRVTIVAKATLPNGDSVNLNSDGQTLEKGSKLSFRAVFGGLSKPYNIRWQIVNLGQEAQDANGLRGTFEDSRVGESISEDALYAGSHSVQCFVTKNRASVFKSDIFIVNIQ